MCEGVNESLQNLHLQVQKLEARVAELERKNTDLELSLDEPWRDNK